MDKATVCPKKCAELRASTAVCADARRTCFMVLRLTSINEPDAIAAGYTEGAAVVLRLLTRIAPDTYGVL